MIFNGDEPNTYNILQVAGSLLGYKHTEESLAKIRGENHHMFGKTHSAETLAKMSEAQKGENNSMFGRTGKNNPMFGRTGENHPMFGKTLSAETKAKMSEAHQGKTFSAETLAKLSIAKGGGIIYAYDLNGTLVNTFPSARKAAIFFESNFNTILKYARNGNIFKEKWILSTSLISKE